MFALVPAGKRSRLCEKSKSWVADPAASSLHRIRVPCRILPNAVLSTTFHTVWEGLRTVCGGTWGLRRAETKKPRCRHPATLSGSHGVV